MRVRGAIVLAALGPAWLALACATERPVASAPRASHSTRAGSGKNAPAETVAPPGPVGPDEKRLVETYGSRRALSVQNGQASYYGNSLAGHKTASGERYDPHAYTAAHRTLPLGTVGRVRRSDTGAVVYVRITDRGPFGSAHRILDLSHAAAEKLGMIRAGVAEVRLEIVEYGPKSRPRRRR